MFLAASQANSLLNFAQNINPVNPINPFNPFAGQPSFDLGASDSATTQSVLLALDRANATGSLPPLQTFNAWLATHSPGGRSPLASLSAPSKPLEVPASAAPTNLPSALTTPVGPIPQASLSLSRPPSLPSNGGLSSPGAPVNYTNEMLAVITTRDSARLIEVQATLLSISYQMVVASELAFNHSDVAKAFLVVAGELQSLAFASGAAASDVQAVDAERVLNLLQEKAKAQDAKIAAASAEAKAGSFDIQSFSPGLAGLLDPSLIYGTWQRLETTLAGQLILYKITRNEFVKINASTDSQGRQAIRTEFHPGAVTAEMSYTLNPDGLGRQEASAEVSVTILVEKSASNRMELQFSFLRAKGSAFGEDTNLVMDVLVEQEGEKKAFVRVSKV